MFERFTDRARRTVVAAQDEARRLDHDYIGTEHLLAGVMTEPESVGARALHSVGIALETVRTDVVALVGRGSGSPTGHIPFTPRSKKVLELSLREALSMGHNYIGTEHIVLGLTREGEGVAAQILRQRGAEPDAIRAAVMAGLARVGASPRPSGGQVSPAGRRTPAADEALSAAGTLAGSGPVGSHHLLEAMVQMDDSLAGKVLAALGVEPDAVAATIADLGLEGTTDLTPEEQAARKMEIRVEGEEVFLVLRDAVTLELSRSISESVGGPIVGTDPAISLVGLWEALRSGLGQLNLEVSPAEPAEGASETGRSAIVRRAVQSRLARRRRPEA